MAKLWAGRFGKETDLEVNDFNSSISFDCRLYKEDITGSMANLKEFLKLRDRLPLYEDARAEGFVGIPSFVKDDGTITRDVEEAMG